MLKQTAQGIQVNSKVALAKLNAEVGGDVLQYFGVSYEQLRRRIVFVLVTERGKMARLVIGKGSSEKIIAQVDERTDDERYAQMQANFALWLEGKRKYNVTHVRGGIALDDVTFEMWQKELYKW